MKESRNWHWSHNYWPFKFWQMMFRCSFCVFLISFLLYPSNCFAGCRLNGRRLWKHGYSANTLPIFWFLHDTSSSPHFVNHLGDMPALFCACAMNKFIIQIALWRESFLWNRIWELAIMKKQLGLVGNTKKQGCHGQKICIFKYFSFRTKAKLS